jgi:hypothetical protein
MTPKFEIVSNHCDQPSDWSRERAPSRLGAAGEKAIGVGLRNLYADVPEAALPEPLSALVVKLQSKENVFRW